MLVLAALFLPVVLGFAALAVDTGVIMHTRTEIQKDADSMALGGAQELCGQASCESAADAVARDLGSAQVLHPVASGERVIQFAVDCAGVASANHDMITVRITRNQPSFLARVVGYEGGNIHACATAKKFALAGFPAGVRPFALEDNCFDTNSQVGTIVVIKYDSASTRNCDSGNGNYAAVAIDGNGANIYRNTIKFGSTTGVCADSVPGCSHYVISTEPGNMIGPTRTGIDYLINNTPASCDTFAEVFNSTTQELNTACDPWKPSYSGAATRIIVIPVVDGLWSTGGRHDVTIKKFALVFVEGYQGSCTGNSCDVQARFIKAQLTIPGADKTQLNPASEVTTVVLTR